jgi:manganese transport protein
LSFPSAGNWAANLKAGSSSGYTLLFAILFSSCLAVCFQVMCVKLGLSTGKDLAQLSREHLPKWTRYPLWLLIEIAIIATDMAVSQWSPGIFFFLLLANPRPEEVQSPLLCLVPEG